MPRYLGVLWPAVVISRQRCYCDFNAHAPMPGRSRCCWASTLLSLRVHLRAREAPIDRMARDVLDMARLESHLLT